MFLESTSRSALVTHLLHWIRALRNHQPVQAVLQRAAQLGRRRLQHRLEPLQLSLCHWRLLLRIGRDEHGQRPVSRALAIRSALLRFQNLPSAIRSSLRSSSVPSDHSVGNRSTCRPLVGCFLPHNMSASLPALHWRRPFVLLPPRSAVPPETSPLRVSLPDRLGLPNTGRPDTQSPGDRLRRRRRRSVRHRPERAGPQWSWPLNRYVWPLVHVLVLAPA